MKCCSLVTSTAGPIWLIRFFLMFVIVQIRFSWNKKVEKVARKIGKFGKNLKCFFLWVFVMDMRSFFFVLFVMVLDKFSGKKIRNNYKGKSKNLDKLQKL
jgi:hypothetical protein